MKDRQDKEFNNINGLIFFKCQNSQACLSAHFILLGHELVGKVLELLRGARPRLSSHWTHQLDLWPA